MVPSSAICPPDSAWRAGCDLARSTRPPRSWHTVRHHRNPPYRRRRCPESAPGECNSFPNPLVTSVRRRQISARGRRSGQHARLRGGVGSGTAALLGHQLTGTRFRLPADRFRLPFQREPDKVVSQRESVRSGTARWLRIELGPPPRTAWNLTPAWLNAVWRPRSG